MGSRYLAAIPLSSAAFGCPASLGKLFSQLGCRSASSLRAVRTALWGPRRVRLDLDEQPPPN